MKKAILFAAALFVAVASFAQNEYNYQKRSLFEQLPIRGNDIVFLGNSITDGCEWAELFNNRSRTAASAPTVRDGCSTVSIRSSTAIPRNCS